MSAPVAPASFGLTELLFGVGVGSLATGLYMIWPPLLPVFIGAGLLSLAIWRATRSPA